ncbi:MAG TPA: DUF5668 domain-containing protein [Thermoanaerobaculia bacterium]
MESQSGFRLTPRLMAGFFIALFGLLLLLDNHGTVDAGYYLQYWPIALIGLGIAKVAQGQNRGFGLVLVFLGTWLLLDVLDWVEFDGDLLFPALILLLGLNLLWKELGRRSGRQGGVNPGDEVHAFAMFGGVKQLFASQTFRGGTASAIFGAAEIDLRQAGLAGGQATIDALALWGGVDIFVPEGWEVVLRGMPFMGAFEDNTRQIHGENPPQLIITGLAFMGAVEVKNLPKSGR